MGKVRIVSGGEEGLYIAEKVYDEKTYLQLKNFAELQAEHAAESIAELEPKIADVQAQLNELLSQINALINELVDAMAERDQEAINTVQRKINALQFGAMNARSQLSALELQKSMHQARKLNAELSLQDLESIPEPTPQSVWCADLTEDLSGVVNSIDVPGEEGGPLIIYPASQADPIIANRGLLCPRNWMTPSQAYLNAAILPGIQKYKPNLRTGKILRIDGDFADVELDPVKSSAQSLPINQNSTLYNVPINYMNCNGGAFETNDNVVIEFIDQEFTNPVIIGFTSNPRSCAPDVYVAFDVSDLLKLYATDDYIMKQWDVYPRYMAFRNGNKFTVRKGEVFHVDYDEEDNRSSILYKNGSIAKNFGAAYDDTSFSDAAITSTKKHIWIASPTNSGQRLNLFQLDPETLEEISVTTLNTHLDGGGFYVQGMAATEKFIHLYATGSAAGEDYYVFDIENSTFVKQSFSDPTSFRMEDASAFGGEVCFSVNIFANPWPPSYKEIWIFKEGDLYPNFTRVVQNPDLQAHRLAGVGVTPKKLVCAFQYTNEVQVYDRDTGLWTFSGAYRDRPFGIFDPNQGGTVVIDPLPNRSAS